MGNRAVKCTDGARRYETAPPPPPITAAPPAEPASTLQSDVVGNPGDYEDLGKKVKELVMPTPIDGCKVVINKGLSRHLQTAHTLTLGSSRQPTQWQFCATYVGTKKIAENEYHPVLIGDMSSNGSFTALYLHQLAKAWRLKVNMQTQQSRWVGYQGTLDYQGSNFTLSTTVANPDVISGSGVAVLQYLQALTPRLSLGAEVLYQRGGGMETSFLSLGGAYKATDWELAARVGLHAWNVSYLHKLKSVTLATEFEGNLMQGDTVAAIGYRAEMLSFNMRSKIDSQGTVTAVVEKRLDPLPATLSLSGQLNHWVDECKFGIGLTVGS